jgi:hypothetical protein
LNHDQPDCFKHDSANLEKNTDDDEIDFAETGDHDTQDDYADVHQLAEVVCFEFEGPCTKKDYDGGR